MRSALLPSSDMVLQLYELWLWVLYFIWFNFFIFIFMSFFFFLLFFVCFSCFLMPIWFWLDQYRHQRRRWCSYRAVRGRVRLVLSPSEELLWPRNTRATGNKERRRHGCLFRLFRLPRQGFFSPPVETTYFTGWASDTLIFLPPILTFLNYLESRLCLESDEEEKQLSAFFLISSAWSLSWELLAVVAPRLLFFCLFVFFVG